MFRPVLFTLLLCLNTSVWALPSWEEYRKPIDEKVGNPELVDRLFYTMYQKEREHNASYYVAYTAMEPAFFVYQTLLSELDRQAGIEVPETFFYLRDWCDFEQFKSPGEFLAEHPHLSKPHGLDDPGRLPDDTNPEISKYLISASSSCQFTVNWDSATGVYLDGKGVSNHHGKVVLTRLLTDRLLARGYDFDEVEAHLEHLQQVMPYAEDGSGLMIQFFIDRKADLEAIGYPSGMNGYRSKMSSRKGGEFFSYTSFSEYYAKFEELQHDSDIDWEDPEHQIRLMPGALHPETCRMYRYWDVPAEELTDFVEEIRQVAADLLASKN